MKMTPGQYIVEVFGGVNAAARALGVTPAAVSRWKSNKRRIGPEMQGRILETARKQKLSITPNDLILGH